MSQVIALFFYNLSYIYQLYYKDAVMKIIELKRLKIY